MGTHGIKGSCSRPRSHLYCFTCHRATIFFFVKGSLDPQMFMLMFNEKPSPVGQERNTA